MKTAELQYSKNLYPSDPLATTEALDVHKTLEHLVEVINEMQERIKNMESGSQE